MKIKILSGVSAQNPGSHSLSCSIRKKSELLGGHLKRL